MDQNRLSSLAILNIENGNIYLIDIDEVLEEFVNNKNRRTKFFLIIYTQFYFLNRFIQFIFFKSFYTK
jgi:hypothetical protein